MLEYAWLMPLFPFLTFWAIVLFTNPNKKLSGRLAIGSIFLSLLVAMGVLGASIGSLEHLAEAPFYRYILWMPIGEGSFRLGYMIDPLAAAGLGMVTIVCSMIFIYSQGYMHGDPRYSRFFAYICLFATGMLGLLISNNLVELFIFWEVMGLCSYLLIGFWFERPSAYRAAIKAFLTTKVGDVIFFLGIVYLYSQTGTLEFEHIFEPDQLHALAAAHVNLPLVGSVPVATLIGLLIFGGAVGKSAQFPLHVWLPDAMEGPTPCSALIHAATMVAAGIFLVARTFPIFNAVEHSTSLVWVAGIGAFTALFASTIAIAQDDIKRVLAYSTISQLGYMTMALGVGGLVAAVFHLITHGFFKSLLFLGSGSVIHGSGSQDMMEMGGLRKEMPITFWTFLIGSLALAGVPPLAGFWSKDEILAEAFHHKNYLVWAMGTLAAFITAFYVSRQIFLTFFGERRKPHAHAHESPSTMTYPLIVLATFAALLGFVAVPADFPVLGSLLGRNPFHHFVAHGHEGASVNFPVMSLSILVALGGLSLGYLIYGRVPLKWGQPDPLIRKLGFVWTVLRNKYWIDELYGATFIRGTIAIANAAFFFDRSFVDRIVNLVGRGIAAFAVLSGLFDTYIIDGLVNLVGRGTAAFATLNDLFDMYIIDGLVNLAGRGGAAISELSLLFDLHIIDGLVNLTGKGTAAISALSRLSDMYVIDGLVNFAGEFSAALGRVLRLIQTGKAQEYLLVIILGILALMGLYLYM